MFEQRLGALFAAAILSGARLDARLSLGEAAPTWMRFETEAPVDDLLIATTNDGFVAIQAKTTAALSVKPDSPFARTIEQFVRHWFTCRSGDGSLGWNRPLDPSRDRLVLAVSSQTAVPVRLDFPAALRLFSQPGGGQLTQAQQRAFDVFSDCVRTAWANLTSEPFDQATLDDLARLVVVFAVDLEGADAKATATSLENVVAQTADARTVFGLLTEVSGTLMARRGGGDLATFRQELSARGVRLSAPPRYKADIDRLRRHSEEVAESLNRYEAIEAQSGMPVTIDRDCQTAIERAALSGPLLIVGEPGAGKSGVLNAMARSLRLKGQDVLELAVDRYSVETLEGLTKELQLEHDLLDVLESWDGADPAWLIIDALDATRGGKGEGVFRHLIERVLERSGRWQVIASIRSFDLRMGQQFRQLFKGAPPIKQLTDPSFSNVRHVLVPRWSGDEFDRLLALAPVLSHALEHAPARLKDLAKVPFNTRLVGELLSRGILAVTLNRVSSQGQLLRLYWEYRIEGHGLAAKACLRTLVDWMVKSRTLRAPTLIAGADPTMIDTLTREGVLIRVESDRWVQFRHHLLFDFAASQALLEPDQLVSGEMRFPKMEARGLMLAPALGFVLQEIWDSESNHARFWMAIGHLVADQTSDPIIRSAAGRIGAEYPLASDDALWLAERAADGDALAVTALNHVSSALAVRIEDDCNVELLPWARLASALAISVASIPGTLRLLLHLLVEKVSDTSQRGEIGVAARALLAHGLSLDDPGVTVRSAISFVADTYGTNPVESRQLLVRLFTSERFQAFGSEEIPALCYKIEAIVDFDPPFVAQVFGYVYALDVHDDRKTSIGYSQIMSLTSSARQDYEIARYSLSECFPKFLESHPESAVDAVVGAVNGYVARKHPISNPTVVELTDVKNNRVRLSEDLSHIWAHDPDTTFGEDAEVLIVQLLKHLRTSSEDDAIEIARLLRDKASMAIFWSRLFLAATERGDALIDELWPVAASEEFVMLADTQKDAIDLISKGVTRRPEPERRSMESTFLNFDYSKFVDPEGAKARILLRLFSAIGLANLLTPAAQEILANAPIHVPSANDRLFNLRSVEWGEVPPYHWIRDLDGNVPSNAALISALGAAKTLLGLPAENSAPMDPVLELTQVLGVLNSIRTLLLPTDIHPMLRIDAEGVIGQGCALIVKRKFLTPTFGIDTVINETSLFIDLLRIASQSEWPSVDADTEASFERSPSWSSPAPRVDAAEVFFELCYQRPDLFETLQHEIKTLLGDPHPAVRLQAMLRLVRFWDIDRKWFWHVLIERLECEKNLSIVESTVGEVIGRVLHSEPQRALGIVLDLLTRVDIDQSGVKRIRGLLGSEVAVLWVTHSLDEAHVSLQSWINEPAVFANELRRVLSTVRSAVVAGLADPDDKEAAFRGRALVLISNIVDAANLELAAHYARPASTDAQLEDARNCAQLIDVACQELLFATGGSHASDSGQSKLEFAGLKRFLKEAIPVLEHIGDFATPHTVYNLLQLLERLAPIDPGKVFDLAAHALRSGARSGFQHESLGIGLLVKLIGMFLADHKEIFENEDRRLRLIDSLDIFMEAGWPAARRLLYRLPELIQ